MTSEEEDQRERDSYLSTVEAQDLIEFGMIPEFVGRFPALVPFHSLTEDMLVRLFAWTRTVIALCVRLNRKWEIGLFPPQHPFSPGIVISDRIFGDCPLPSFTFDISLRTS